MTGGGFSAGTAVARTPSAGSGSGGGVASDGGRFAGPVMSVVPMHGVHPPDYPDAGAGSDAGGPQSWPARARLPARHTARFLVLVALWYVCSSLTNNIGKEILERFRYPVTLTVAQFGFIGMFTYIYTTVLWWTSDRRGPRPLMPLTRTVVGSVVPLAGFNIIGHIFSSVAISRVPVSFVHTIKAVSPFFTVVLSTVILRSRYSRDVYVALVPLVVGVILACTSELQWEFGGGLAALASALVFVVQNIFSKKVFQDGQLDELNLLYYSSTASFLFLLPFWLYVDGIDLLLASGSGPAMTTDLLLLFLANGITHFGQNIFAFTIMTLVSPVTYSIASLFKRVVIIISALVYFETTITPLNVVGLVLTFGGLYMYNNAREGPAHATAAATSPDSPRLGAASSLSLPLAVPQTPTSSGPPGTAATTALATPPPPPLLPPPLSSPPPPLPAQTASSAFPGGRVKTVAGFALAGGHRGAPGAAGGHAVLDGASFIPRRDSDLMLAYSKA